MLNSHEEMQTLIDSLANKVLRRMLSTLVVGSGMTSCVILLSSIVPLPVNAESADFSFRDNTEYLRDERAHLDGKTPKIGLALSGGGTKAGMFSHGVLHGLRDAGVLKHIDVISSVSGGGYAAYWYFSKILEAERSKQVGRDPFTIDDVFRDCFPMWYVRQSAKLDKTAIVFNRIRFCRG